MIGIIALTLFVLRSARIDQPIINLALLRKPLFTVSILAFACLQIAALALSFLMPNYIQLVNHNSALVAGLVLLPGAAIGAAVSPVGGRLLDQSGPKLPLRVGALFVLVGIVGMFITGERLSNPLIIGWYTAFMVGIGISFGDLMTTGLQQVHKQEQSDGNALFNTTQQFTAALGTSLASTIVAAGQAGTHNLVQGTTAGTVNALGVVVAIAAAETILVWVLTARVPSGQQ